MFIHESYYLYLLHARNCAGLCLCTKGNVLEFFDHTLYVLMRKHSFGWWECHSFYRYLVQKYWTNSNSDLMMGLNERSDNHQSYCDSSWGYINMFTKLDGNPSTSFWDKAWQKREQQLILMLRLVQVLFFFLPSDLRTRIQSHWMFSAGWAIPFYLQQPSKIHSAQMLLVIFLMKYGQRLLE